MNVKNILAKVQFLHCQNVSLQHGRITGIHEAEYESCI